MGLDGKPHSTVAGSTPARFIGRKAGQQETQKKHEVRKMKNAILEICVKLRGYSETEPYFEVTEAKQNENGTYTVIVKAVDPAEDQGAANESNE